MKKGLFAWVVLAGMSISIQAQNDSMKVSRDSVTWNKELEGVTIQAQRQLIKQKIDRIGYEVQADEESKTQTVFDMLRKVPMVSIDGEDNIRVKGNSSFKIYKNGHLDPSMTKNAKEILKGMPATMVKRIEVITDPGAREDAEGVDAILNIVMMDTRKMEGVTGSVSARYGTLNNPSLSTYLATQIGKAVISLDYGYQRQSEKSSSQDSYQEKQYVASGQKLTSRTISSNPGYLNYLNLNASYDIDSLNLLSASFGGYFYKVNIQGTTEASREDALGNQLYRYDEHYWMPSYMHHSWNGRLDYQHKAHRKGEQFTLSYMLTLTRQDTERETTYFNQQNVPFAYSGYLIDSRERFTEHTFQADYVRPLWTGHKLEVGAKFIDRRNSSDNRQDFMEVSRFPSYSTQFEHTTDVLAGYADYMYHIGKWSARAGLRYEYSYLKGHYPDGKNADFDSHLSDWVPQASLRYQMSDAQSLKLTYTTSIQRPGISYLNPAVVERSERVDFGNAHLVSNHTQGLSLTYMYVGRRLTFQLSPQYTCYNDAIGDRIWVEDNRRYATYGNTEAMRRWLLMGYVQWKPFSATSIVVNLNAWHITYKDADSGLKQSGNGFRYYFYVSQKLPWRLQFTASINGFFGHDVYSVYAYDRPWNPYSLSLQRSFLRDDCLTIRLLASSPFHTHQHYKSNMTQGDILGWSDTMYDSMSRNFSLTVSYRFGKLKASVKKTDTTIENSDVVGGISKGQ